MKSSQDIQKEIDYVMNFAEQMGVPDEVYFQFIAVADNYLRNGDYESAEQQVEQALLAAQSYGLQPEGTIRITESKLRRIIQNALLEHGPFHGGHEGRGVDMADPMPQDPTIRHWQDFKDAVMEGDYDSASEFLSEIGCEDRMDQEAFMGDATELTADELAKEWQYRLQSLQEGTYEKLNSTVTGDSANLDQEVFFGLSEDVLELCEKYANDPRYAQYGITVDDVLEELKNVVSDIQVS